MCNSSLYCEAQPNHSMHPINQLHDFMFSNLGKILSIRADLLTVVFIREVIDWPLSISIWIPCSLCKPKYRKASTDYWSRSIWIGLFVAFYADRAQMPVISTLRVTEFTVSLGSWILIDKHILIPRHGRVLREGKFHSSVGNLVKQNCQNPVLITVLVLRLCFKAEIFFQLLHRCCTVALLVDIHRIRHI